MLKNIELKMNDISIYSVNHVVNKNTCYFKKIQLNSKKKQFFA